MKIALVGNPNSGKTTLFNSLTKLNQKTGNWGGVTVGLKQGKYFKNREVEIVDLPGIYSLYPYSEEEVITSKFLREREADVVVNVIDSTNLERSLSLTLQLLEVGLPVVLALNMEDELSLSGMEINIESIKNQLKVDAVLVSALKNKNLEQLISRAVAAKGKTDVAPFNIGGETEEEKAALRHDYISGKIASFRKKKQSRHRQITDKIDRIVTNKWLAYPIFAAVIWLMYFVSVQVVGGLCTEALEWFFGDFIGEGIREWMISGGVAQWLTGLTVDGVIGGVGAVLTFIPQIVTLFLFITFLEATGYMARVAFIMDRIFKWIGLSGKSFVPMIIGCGCTVPAIMGTRTIEGQIERRRTIMLAPFIPCSAKLPVFALLAGALFPDNAFVAPSMYFLGIIMVIVCGYIMNRVGSRKAVADTFIIEMPQYRLPKIKSVLIELWDKAKEFFLRAGTIIFIASIAIWLLSSFSFGFSMVENTEDSMLAAFGKIIAPLFIPLGFGTWQAAVALLAGMFAKETVVSTFEILLGGEVLSEAIAGMFTPHAAYALMAFILLSVPCFAAVSATRKELGSSKWLWITIGFQTGVAYVVALFINLIGSLWTYNSGLGLTVLIVLVLAVLAFLCINRITRNKKNGGGCSGNCGGCNRSCKKQ